MNKRKNDIIIFFIWLRNGSAFCISWLLILLLTYHYIFDLPSITTDLLTKMVTLTVGGVFIYSLLFTKLFIKKWSFIKRLTCFMLLIAPYECAGFYWVGFFTGQGSFIQWIIFISLILCLYFICILIYQAYSKNQGELYTQALENYQKERRISDGT